MEQFNFYNVYVHGSFLNEAIFTVLGIDRDADGNIKSVAGFAKDSSGVVQAPPKNAILDPIRRFSLGDKAELWPDSSPRAKAYETKVMGSLRRIIKTDVGSAIFDSMSREKKVVIVPYNSFDTMTAGVCNARTMNRMSFGKYIRVAFTFDETCESSDVEYPTTEDETLLHEMFHAYLMTVSKDGDYYDSMEESSSQEEFLAVQVTNMFRSQTRQGVFQRVYGNGTGPTRLPTAVTRSQLETYLQSDEKVLDVLNPDGVSLFQKLAGNPSIPFNPFRNWGVWKQTLQTKKLSSLKNPKPTAKTASAGWRA